MFSGYLMLVAFVLGAVFLILLILLPFFVFRIFQETVETNKLLRKILNATDPGYLEKESAAIREAQEYYSKRRPSGHTTAAG